MVERRLGDHPHLRDREFCGARLLRCKGIVHIAEIDRPVVVHGVQHVFDAPVPLAGWPSEDHRSRLVCITRDFDEAVLRADPGPDGRYTVRCVASDTSNPNGLLISPDGRTLYVSQCDYGVDKVRFPSPVPVGSRLRGTGTLLAATEVPGGVQAVTRVTIEREGSDKPAAIVDTVSRYLA